MENKIQPLNYCRQIRKRCIQEEKILNKAKKNLVLLDETAKAYALSLFEKEDAKLKEEFFYLKNSVKFALPEGGVSLGDMNFKGIDDDGFLRLPFENTILEYEFFRSAEKHEETIKTTLALKEITDYDGQKSIQVNTWWFIDGLWVWASDYIRLRGLVTDSSGKRNFALRVGDEVLNGFKNETELAGLKITVSRIATVVCDFLNVLSCSNVHIEKLPVRKAQKGKKMDALPFDEYHILTVGTPSIKNSAGNYAESVGDRHSPREHLRRGHIRRLQDGRKIWVNAAIINAGVAGKIYKNYVVH